MTVLPAFVVSHTPLQSFLPRLQHIYQPTWSPSTALADILSDVNLQVHYLLYSRSYCQLTFPDTNAALMHTSRGSALDVLADGIGVVVGSILGKRHMVCISR